ncbi:MAG: hypothetical protein KDC80_05175 [Saprospiraceae bacterium]|nr:hypothetical protein [Saprospiraceae bacterium]
MTSKIKTLIVLFILPFMLHSQEISFPENGYWQIGFGLGELPTGGSFKPSISVGYHVNEKIYAGIIYQLKDHIARNQASINARSSGLTGLNTASEIVAQRFLAQIRYKPFRNGPYLSTGIVFNGRDRETMVFDHRDRQLFGEEYTGDIGIIQSRPAGWGLAAGVGYEYRFKNGVAAGFEWTPAWAQYPEPEYEFGGEAGLSSNTKKSLQDLMNGKFKSSVTNMYKVFHLGISYHFQD